MSKPNFNLQKAQFSDSDQETPMQLSAAVLNNYSRQYSLIYQQISVFLKGCKDNILKYISLNQFGVGFNIYNIFTHISKIQTTMLSRVSDVQKQKLDHRKNLKNKYQKEFQFIVQRMGAVIQDFIKFQVEFKREYFGFNLVQSSNKSQPRKSLRLGKSPGLIQIGSQHSVSSGSSLRKKLQCYSRQSEDTKQTEIQQKLRDILKIKLAPQKQNIIKFCDIGSDPFKNLSKLEQKIDMMQSEMILSKTRQEKVIQIFNKRRIQNIQARGQNLVHCQLIQTDDGNRMNNLSENNQNPKGKSIIDKPSEPIKYDFQNKNSSKKLETFVRPSLDFQMMNCPKYPQQCNQPTSSSSIYGSDVVDSPKKLISPKGLRNLRQPNNSTFNFFNSSKNHQFSKKPSPKSPVNFKKKKGQQAQASFSKPNTIDQSMQRGPEKLIQDNQNAALNRNINKNRSLFMERRSYNELLHPGVNNQGKES